MKRAEDVFGVASNILPDSYVDRGELDEKITSYLQRDNHIAIRGASKSGKSWLRQRVIPDAIVIQCRLGKSVVDIYREALGQIGIALTISRTNTHSMTGTVEAETEVGNSLVARVRARLGLAGTISHTSSSEHLRQNINDLDFIAALLGESGRRLVIEDFHYLSQDERKKLAFDLKALWDLNLFVVVVGVWSDNNLLLHLNPDLTGRVREVSILWAENDLREILSRGAEALNLKFGDQVVAELVSLSHGNAGILQRITLDTLDEAGISQSSADVQVVESTALVDNAAMFYAEELNTVYQTFAQNVSSGIRRRRNSTGIYAHALAVVLDSEDGVLMDGVPFASIYRTSHDREPRIQQGNLKTALGNIERLQVDTDGRGLVLSYANNRVRVVDHQLLLYRRFATVQWPWEEIIAQAEEIAESSGVGYADDTDPIE